MKKYLLGIDNGGTVSKAALFDVSGRQILKKSIQIPLITQKEGFTERDMGVIRKANFSIIREITDSCDGEIIAVGLTGHGKGLYVLGDHNEIIYNGISSTDTRALSYELLWREDGTADRVYTKIAQKLLACQPAALLRWMKDNRRDIYDKIRWILSVKNYVRFCLTDTVNAEYTDISGTGLLNLRTGSYDDSLLDEYGIAEMKGKLPPVLASADVCGAVTEAAAAETGLKEGIAVTAGMFDIDACALAMGNILKDDMCVIAGTWSINEYISDRIIDDRSVAMNSIFCDPEFYLAEESSAASAGNLEWFRAVLKDKSYAEFDEMVKNTDAASCRVYYLPFLYASNENPFAKAALIGLNGSHTMAHMIRAIYEGVVFSHMTHLNNLLAGREKPPFIRLAGGAANSAVWAQMFADVIGIDIYVIAGTELGAKGAAMAAGIGAGIYRDYKDAAEKCVTVQTKFIPDPQKTEIYRKKYGAYKRIINVLDGVWADL